MLELRAADDGDVLYGHFPYNTVTLLGTGHREMFRAGSLDTADKLPILRQHDPARAIARSALAFDAKGITLQLPVRDLPDTNTVRDTLAEIRCGILGGISPRFHVLPGGQARSTDGVRVITRAVLKEMSLVTVPAYVDSTVEMREAVDRYGRMHWWL